eukprot:7387497-Prymnesium_polylepis.2
MAFETAAATHTKKAVFKLLPKTRPGLLPLRLTVELARECMVGMWVWWLSEPGGPGRPEQQKRGVALGVSFFCILLAITGAVLLPIGLAELAFAERCTADTLDSNTRTTDASHMLLQHIPFD